MKKNLAIVLAVIIATQLVLVPLAQAADKGGPVPCLVGMFFGPRAGYQWNEGYKIRSMEWYTLIGYAIFGLGVIPLIIQLVDIWGGKTWTEIVQKEALHASHFDAWHNYAAVR
jgi:hypothetical protein